MTTAADKAYLQHQGLYDPSNEHDACGVGFVAHIKGQKATRSWGRRSRSWKTSTTAVRSALTL